jgi:hypothetical protein
LNQESDKITKETTTQEKLKEKAPKNFKEFLNVVTECKFIN